jgi:transcriptional regulator
MLILKTLTRGSQHGYGIAQHLKLVTEEVVQVGEGSLYPALQRLLVNGLVQSEWQTTGKNRRARYYSITQAGRRYLEGEAAQFRRKVRAIERVMEGA